MNFLALQRLEVQFNGVLAASGIKSRVLLCAGFCPPLRLLFREVIILLEACKDVCTMEQTIKIDLLRGAMYYLFPFNISY